MALGHQSGPATLCGLTAILAEACERAGHRAEALSRVRGPGRTGRSARQMRHHASAVKISGNSEKRGGSGAAGSVTMAGSSPRSNKKQT
jgi:hypothetical protein